MSKLLKEILSPFWYEKLYKIILKNDDYKLYLDKDRELTFPKLGNTFKAINDLDNGNAKIVIFGQDPYPREESATGIAFQDGRVESWESKKLSPSLRNIFKSILINENLVDKDIKIAQMREIIKENNVISPIEFFEKSKNNGIVWLNASLTFTSKKSSDLKRHLKFWEPVIDEIILTLLKNNENLIFIFWGNRAKKFQTLINTQKRSYHFVENCHPMLNSFHEKNNFQEIDQILKSNNLEEINWI